MEVSKFIAEIQNRIYLGNCWRLGLLATDIKINEIPREVIDKFLKDHIGFQCFTEEEVSTTESKMNCNFPALFREYLLKMGKSNTFFEEQDIIDVSEYPGMVQYLKDCIEDSNDENSDEDDFEPLGIKMPENAIIFMQHQGYQYFYVLPEDEIDPVIYVDGNCSGVA